MNILKKVVLAGFLISSFEGSALIVSSPMTCKISMIHVLEGSYISQGDPLISMECMKQNLTIRSPIDGLANEIFIDEGDKVNLGDKLLRVVEQSDAIVCLICEEYGNGIP